MIPGDFDEDCDVDEQIHVNVLSPPNQVPRSQITIQTTKVGKLAYPPGMSTHPHTYRLTLNTHQALKYPSTTNTYAKPSPTYAQSLLKGIPQTLSHHPTKPPSLPLDHHLKGSRNLFNLGVGSSTTTSKKRPITATKPSAIPHKPSTAL